MYRSRPARLAIVIFGFALICLFVYPRPAAADSIVTVSFTGTTGPCSIFLFGAIPCSSVPASTTITGTYNFDLTTESIVGPWSFSTFFGAFSGTGGLVTQNQESGNLTLYFGGLEFDGAPGDLALTFSNGFGPLITSESINGFSFDPSSVNFFGDNTITHVTHVYLVSGEASPVATPEPATLLLLGLGLLVCAPLIRRHFSHANS